MARKTTTKTSFDEVTSRLGQLSRGELVELGDMVAALLAATAEAEDADDDQVAELADKGDKRGARGHIEAKTVNGCGPYLYLRYWQGKTLKSKYIGKAKK